MFDTLNAFQHLFLLTNVAAILVASALTAITELAVRKRVSK